MLKADQVDAVLKKGDSARLEVDRTPRFAAGDAVLTCNEHPHGHTRIPRYARGRRGIIERCHGVFIFPDVSAASGERQPQHCYSVRFTMRELWGSTASADDGVYIDLFEPYLRAAEN